MLSRGVLVLMSAVLGVACTAGGGQDAGPGRDGGSDAAPAQPDAGPQRCDTNAECDDGLSCTIDECIVGNVCRHDPIDGRCDTAAGERCVVGRGCVSGTPTDCETHADCDDGNVCNGAEQCIVGGCFMGTPRSCDDGNACTTDTCDESATSGCRYELICDGGITTVDAAIPCDEFNAGDYPGTFSFRPSVLSACTGSAVYNVREITLSVAADTLRVSLNSAPFSLTQSPAPTDGTFDVTYVDSCGSYRLQGTFTCADRWEGTWTANFSGSCSFCPSQSETARGSRS